MNDGNRQEMASELAEQIMVSVESDLLVVPDEITTLDATQRLTMRDNVRRLILERLRTE